MSLPLKFRKTYRAEWILNFFKKKRGDFLIVAYKNKKVIGFILMLKKSFGLQIDLIVSSKKYQNKKVGTSLINYINNNFLKKEDIIRAGTQLDNIKANNIYKKLGFVKKSYVYHIHSNTNKKNNLIMFIKYLNILIQKKVYLHGQKNNKKN